MILSGRHHLWVHKRLNDLRRRQLFGKAGSIQALYSLKIDTGSALLDQVVTRIVRTGSGYLIGSGTAA